MAYQKTPEPVVEFRKYLKALQEGCPEAPTPMTEQIRIQFMLRIHELDQHITGLLASQKAYARQVGADRRMLNKAGKGDA